MVRKRRFFLKKTKSFGSKNEVLAPLTLRFFRKKRRLFGEIAFLLSEKCGFDRKQAQNKVKILPTSLFRFLDLLFGK